MSWNGIRISCSPTVKSLCLEIRWPRKLPLHFQWLLKSCISHPINLPQHWCTFWLSVVKGSGKILQKASKGCPFEVTNIPFILKVHQKNRMCLRKCMYAFFVSLNQLWHYFPSGNLQVFGWDFLITFLNLFVKEVFYTNNKTAFFNVYIDFFYFQSFPSSLHLQEIMEPFYCEIHWLHLHLCVFSCSSCCCLDASLFSGPSTTLWRSPWPTETSGASYAWPGSRITPLWNLGTASKEWRRR